MNRLANLLRPPKRIDSDEWYTPPHIIESLGSFDLDPACGRYAPRTAKRSYAVDGLARRWFGRVWLNPPFSGAKPWIDRLREHGNGIALVFSRIETAWFQQAAIASGCFFALARRIEFLRPKTAAHQKAKCPLGCVLIPFGADNIAAVEGSGLPGLMLYLK